MIDPLLITAILVPQGAECAAVCRGLRRAGRSKPTLIPIPMGITPVRQFLKAQKLQTQKLQPQRLESPESTATRSQILVMGLCGSLTPDLQVGDGVVYESCLSLIPSSKPLECDRSLTQHLLTCLQADKALTARKVIALTSDRFIHLAQEKRSLGQTRSAEVVDMEGTAILDVLEPAQFAVAMLRVVSDDVRHDMPDLGNVSSPEGAILSDRLALALLRQPFAGLRLIRGSLRGLRSLEQLTHELFA